MRRCIVILALLLLADRAMSAPVDASTFGFDTAADDNYAAFQAMEDYANTNGTADIVFGTAGQYKVTLPAGAGVGAAWFTNVTGLAIDAGDAEFYCTNLVATTKGILKFTSCTNVSVRANFLGEHTGAEVDSMSAIHLVGSNDTVSLNVVARQVRYAVKVGDYELPEATPTYTGNRNITVVCTNYDCTYGVAFYLVDGGGITNYSEGTVTGSFGSDRATYLTGCSNVTAKSTSKNLHITDAVVVVGSAPSASPPYHFGCSNITLTIVDAGTTNEISGQHLLGINIVSGHSAIDTNVIHNGVNATITVPSIATGFSTNKIVKFSSVGTNAAHVFTNITLRGNFARQAENTSGAGSSTLYMTHSGLYGLSALYLTLDDFHDDLDYPDEYTGYFSSTNTTIRVTAYNSDLCKFYFGNTNIQSLTDYGEYRRLRTTTLRAGTLRGP